MLDPTHDRFLRRPDVETLIGCAKTKLYDMIRRGEFPRVTRFGMIAVWRKTVIDAWMNAQEK